MAEESPQKGSPSFALRAASGTVDRGIARAGDAIWRLLKRRPYFGVGVAAAAGLGAATLVGAAELAVAVAAGYAAYQVLKYDVPPSEAVRKAVEIEHQVVPT